MNYGDFRHSVWKFVVIDCDEFFENLFLTRGEGREISCLGQHLDLRRPCSPSKQLPDMKNSITETFALFEIN
jgi:hypothetical protein